MDLESSWPSLLSRLLVAFTVEADNEFEHRMPHRTAQSRAAGLSPRGPWLVSLAMWSNFLQHVPAEGISLDNLERASRLGKLPLAGMKRWGYVNGEALIVPTRAGRRAAAIWAEVVPEIEGRWMQRLGTAVADHLRGSLATLVDRSEWDLPDYLPTFGYGRWTQDAPRRVKAGGPAATDLAALMSRVLLIFALDFEGRSGTSLVLFADFLETLDDSPVLARSIPLATGVAKDTTKVALGFLERRGYLTPSPQGVALTAAGAQLKREATKHYERCEREYKTDDLRAVLERIGQLGPARLAEGLRPYPDGWRASKPFLPQTKAVLADPLGRLPRFPVVTHRGGFPDGS